MVVFVATGDLPRVAGTWTEAGQRFFVIGNVVSGSRQVRVEPPPEE